MRIKYRPTKKPKTINDRFLECMWDIIEFHRENEGKIVDVDKFAVTIGLQGNAFHRYNTTDYTIPIKVFKVACDIYRISPTYVIMGEGERFLDVNYQKEVIAQRIVKQRERERRRKEIKAKIEQQQKEISERKKALTALRAIKID